MRGWRGEVAWEATGDGRRTPGKKSNTLCRAERVEMVRGAEDPIAHAKVDLEVRLEPKGGRQGLGGPADRGDPNGEVRGDVRVL